MSWEFYDFMGSGIPGVLKEVKCDLLLDELGISGGAERQVGCG